ncbi:peptidase domain-containing ABC transporter [Flaviaesturariibacter flavus]|uniref:Peptidase domain-containing ABC transporter n=1 Tax=Flaviaesturariibacter flavus TaxID=2502780 RepID=A0A4R1BPP1_9BACT|nr:peptidase domain-containing ABC transporter [Flaviaesturariibacter flavus]TCJ19600.1 peptidase domain-containing ABC transporter [Flaviaesturariibacter flavus]
MAFPFYKQPDAMDCGPTCLRMIAKHYRRYIPLQILRDKTQIGKEGVNLLGLSEAAEAIGFRTKAFKIDLDTLLKEAALPAILHWKQNHFVVLYKAKKNTVFIADPAKGLVEYTRKEFSSYWSGDMGERGPEGIVLLLEPSPAFYKNELTSDSETEGLQIKNIFRYILPYKKLAFQLLLGLGVSSLIQLVLPFLTQSVVDTGINTGNLQFIYIVLAAQLALFAGRLAVEFVRSWILLHISTRINLSILTDFLIKLMKLPVSFFDSKHTGDILQRMNDHSRIENFLTGSSLNTLFSLVNLVVFSVVLALFNSNIFAVFAIASLLYAVWVVAFLKKAKALDYKRFEVASREQSATIQLIQGMTEIKLNGVEKPMRWAWEGLQARMFRLSMKGLSLTQWQQAGAFFVNEGKNIFITFLAAKSVIDGQMTLGAMLAVQYIIGQLNSPIEQLLGFLQSWQNARISMGRLNEIHTLDDEERESSQLQFELPASFTRQLVGGGYLEPGVLLQREYEHHPGAPRDFSNVVRSVTLSETPAFTHNPAAEKRLPTDAVTFNNVSFTYPGAGNEPVLRNINLTIPVGKTTAIVGVSGSGKTTLLKLLLKFYEAQKGDIRLSATSLANISHKFWRSHCGVVMQESFIFSDTIARNIAVGAERVDMEKLRRATEVANLREFIEALPLGFNTKIGAEGTGISAGQKQRILIARAVYRDPEFIFFDEATNSLDANNENTIIQNLHEFFEGRTVVVVAHRLSTVKQADQIVVLHKGIITERGTHQELVNLKGDYFTLVKNQLELGA